ncbi:MAG: fibronectin type III domain-containing protein [Thermoplasmatota archaeon]
MRCSALIMVTVLLITIPSVTGDPGKDSSDPASMHISDQADLGKSSDLDPMSEPTGSVLSDLVIENRGQLNDDDILFYTLGDPAVAFYDDGYMMTDMGRGSESISSVRIGFAGSSSASVSGCGQTETRMNFMRGDTSITDVGTFTELIYTDLYPGIDLKFSFSRGQLKYDLIVEPGADPGRISLEYHGIDRLDTSDGRSLLFGCGDLWMEDGPLISLQGGIEIPTEFIVNGNSVRFSIEGHDPDRMLIIDPLLKRSTYLGGADWEKDIKVEIDPWDNIIVCGITDSTDFPTTPGVIDRSKAVDTDMFATRFSSDLASLYSATYIGGDGYDYLKGMDVDSNGDIYLAGTTNSGNYPRSSGAYQTSFGGGKDGFITKISNNCKNILFSTLLGGSGDDELTDIAVDSSGSSYITGYTRSSDFHTTTGAYQETLLGTQNGFVTKLSATGDTVPYSSYIGGSDLDYSFCIELRNDTDPIIAGQTISSDFPVSADAYDKAYGGYCGFVTGLDPELTEIYFSTLFSNATWIYDVEIGPDDGIFITGRTQDIKGRFHLSPDAFDRRFEGGEEGFVSKLSHNGSSLIYSSYLGRTENADGIPHFTYEERCADLEVSDEGRAYVVGHTDAPNLYVTKGAFDKTRSERDGMFAVISPDGTELEYCTYLGGNDEDSITDIALNSSRFLFIGGFTYYNYINHDFPVTSGVYDTTFNGGYDAFVTSFKGDSFIPDAPTNPGIVTGDSYANLTWDPPLFDGNEEVTGYNVHQGYTSNPQNTHVIASGITTEFLNVTGLENGYRYFFFIGAVNEVGEGDLASVNGTPLSVPSAPYSPRAEPGDRHVNVTWSGVYDGGAPPVTFNIYLGTDDEKLDMIASGIEGRWFNISELENGVEYFIGISGTNIVGEGPVSAIMKAVPRGLPTEPLDLKISSVGSGFANITWEEPDDDGGAGNLSYTLFNALNETYWAVVTTGINRTGMNITGLRNGRSYTFRVSALNEVGYGPPSNNVTVVPMGNFSPPSEFDVWTVNDTVYLSWKPPLSTGGSPHFTYNVYISTDNVTFDLYEEYLDAEGFVINGLAKGEEYFFSVSAHNGRWEGGRTDPRKAVPRTVPSLPMNQSITSGDLWINLSWDPPADNGGDPGISYEIYWGDDPVYPEITSGTGNRFLNITNIQKGIRYYFWISAVNMMGAGNRTERLTMIVYTPPSAPINPGYQDGDGFIELDWSPSSDKGGYEIVKYRVYMGLSAEDMAIVGNDLADRFFTITGLINGVEYFIGITAFNTAGEGPMTEIISAIPMILSSKPLNLNATGGDGFVNLQWDYPENDGGSPIWMYHIYRNDSSGSFIRIKMIDAAGRSYTDTGVMNGMRYSYRMRAENGVGIGEWSETVNATPRAEVDDEADYDQYIMAGGVLLGVFLAAVSIMIFAVTSSRKRRREERMWAERRNSEYRRKSDRSYNEE